MKEYHYIMGSDDNIYEFFWLAQVNGQSESDPERKLAYLNYEKVVEIGEQNIKANKNILAKAYAWLGRYEQQKRKNYAKALDWFDKLLDIDPTNEEARQSCEQLKKQMNNS
ncbi:MAG TPA: hypothetical protein VFX58_04950 [Chitinophagaceae bacterium]|nr:hypothetical protein [Chitinophagaceae bacterium]